MSRWGGGIGRNPYGRGRGGYNWRRGDGAGETGRFHQATNSTGFKHDNEEPNVRSSDILLSILESIDGKSFQAYKDLRGCTF